MQVARLTTPPPYSSPSAAWREAADVDPIVAAVPPPRYDGLIRACDFPSFVIRVGNDGAGSPVLPWDSVGQLTRALQGQTLVDPRRHAWTESFREQLASVDQITHRMRTEAEPAAFEAAYAARAPFPIVCTPEMHAAISAYYEALDAFLVDLPQLLLGNAAQDVIGDDARTERDGQWALTCLTASVRDLDAHLGELPSPSWRPSIPFTALSLLAGVGGMVGAVCVPSMSSDVRRPSDASMVLRVLASFLGFVPFFVLSARRAYLDDSDNEAMSQLKSRISKVQTELGRFATIAAIASTDAVGTQVTSS